MTLTTVPVSYAEFARSCIKHFGEDNYRSRIWTLKNKETGIKVVVSKSRHPSDPANAFTIATDPKNVHRRGNVEDALDVAGRILRGEKVSN